MTVWELHWKMKGTFLIFEVFSLTADSLVAFELINPNLSRTILPNKIAYAYAYARAVW